MRHGQFLAVVATLCGAACGAVPGATADGPSNGARRAATEVTAVATIALSPLPAPTAAGSATVVPAAVGSTASSAQGDGRLTLAFAGDALWHSPLWRQAERNAVAAGKPGGRDFTPMLASLQPVVGAADLGVCHLETPIAPDGEDFSTFPLYGVPPEVVGAIRAAGFDRCSTASNHVVDRGTAGVDRTVAVLEANGLGQSGMARTPEEGGPRVFTVDGVSVAHLSYTYGFNGLVLPAGEEWRSALIVPQRIIADARRARQLGAQVVFVSLHWGVEGERSITAEQRAVADIVTASGEVDLVVGHHAHVLQPIEQVNGIWVAFGLGNMISNLPTSPRWPAATQDGAIVVVDVTIAADGVVVVATPVVHPTWVDRDHGWVIHLVRPALTNPALDPWLRTQLESSLGRTAEVLGPFLAG